MPETNFHLLPPIAEVITNESSTHGLSRVDNYYWMNECKNPNARAYLEAENEYLNTSLKHTEAFQNNLFDKNSDCDTINYDYMMSYSPYGNIEAKAYPSMLVTTAFIDSQAQYWEPTK